MQGNPEMIDLAEEWYSDIDFKNYK